MKFGIIVFPGSNCDRDMQWVAQGILGQPTRAIWHEETDVADCDVIVIPGGFSYGDYLRCGAIARFSPALRATVEAAQQGRYVIGICNGFQILTESGLLPGALIRNRDLHFICDRVALRVERTDLPWTSGYGAGQVITLPIAHGEGRYFADEDTLKRIEDNHQVVFRYCPAPGQAVDSWQNPNGSLNDIAGICSDRGNILGMMPHPERAADPAMGNTDGLALFEGLVAQALAIA
ncbi:MAG: phosphoribosylformylglycinamidine synthase subunit PurQ [Cyanobacteria bacterium]|nr:phosphoribosylformylglycinamidine synthase subunit PurQ [Cyanobacteriota bacterium]